MGLFSKKDKQPALKPSAERVNIFDTDYPIDRSSWFQVFSACVGRSAAVQEAFAQLVVRNRNWNVDFTARTLSFGEDAYPVQFLGSESSVSNSWMWGWNNVNHFDESILVLAEEIKRLGEQWQLEVFTTDCFALDDTFNGHNLAMAATGVSKKNYCYYRGPHANGNIFMAVEPGDPRVFAPVDIKVFIDWSLSAIQTFYIDHRIFIESFLMWNGTPFDRPADKRIIAHFGKDLLIDFEQAEEFERIKGFKTL